MSVRVYIVFSFWTGALGAGCGRIGFEALDYRSEAADAFDAGQSPPNRNDGGATPVVDESSGGAAPTSGVAGASTSGVEPAPSSEGGGPGASGGAGGGTSSDGGVAGAESGSGGTIADGGAASAGTVADPLDGGPGGGPSAGSSNGGSAGAAPTEDCADGQLNQDESDTDCGGVCAPCDIGQSCNFDPDCSNDLCIAGICRTAGTCTDATLNQDETDLDCGGSLCPQCPDGSDCVRDLDCASASCVAEACQGVGTCNDGTQNQDETGVDCGGLACPACADGLGCEDGTDCQSGLCAGQVCSSATSACMDTADCTCDTRDGHQYWFCRSRTPSDEAPAVCSTVGMALVRIDDADENDWVLEQATLHGLHDVSDILLIGATKVNTHPDWVWPDGEAFWTGANPGSPLNGLYSTWASRAPRASFDCAVMLETGDWLDLNCGASEPFVCESP